MHSSCFKREPLLLFPILCMLAILNGLRTAEAVTQPTNTVITNYSVSTIVGRGQGIDSFQAVAVDPSGTLYVADSTKNAIWKISTNGTPTVLARTGNSSPQGIALDASGKALYISTCDVDPILLAPNGGAAVRKITVASGSLSTLAGGELSGYANGSGTNALFNAPIGLAVDRSSNVYVADCLNASVRKITPKGVVSTVAGGADIGFRNGTGTNASFFYPCGLAFGNSGNLYLTDSLDTNANVIRRIDSNGVVSTFAGGKAPGFKDGTGTNAMFNLPSGVASDSSGNLFVTDFGNRILRKISSNGIVSTIAGNPRSSTASADGIGTNASFGTLQGIAVDSRGNLFVADLDWGIRKISPMYDPNYITFNSIPQKTFGDKPFPLTASASSGLPVSFSSSSPWVARLSNNTVIITGAGTTTFTASQSGNSNIPAATPVQRVLVVNKASNPITFIQPAPRTFVKGGSFPLAATSPAGAVAFSSGSTNLMVINGYTAVMKGAGTVSITATQVGNTNYLSASNVVRVVVINRAPQNITFTPTPTNTFVSGGVIHLVGSASSGLVVSYTSGNTNVLSISGTNAIMRTKGEATVTAFQPGNADYLGVTNSPVKVLLR